MKTTQLGTIEFCWVLAYWSLLVTVACGDSIRADDRDVEKVIRGYEQSLSVVTSKVSFKAETETFREGDWNWIVQSRKTYISAHVCRDIDGRLDTSTEITYDADDPGRRIRMQIKVICTDQVMQYQAPEGHPPEFIAVDSDTKKWGTKVSAYLLDGVVLDGLVVGDNGLALPQILRTADRLVLRDEMETVRGRQTYVLEAKGKYGEHILWIDPNQDFVPRRITVRKRGDDLFDERPLSVVPQNMSPNARRPGPDVAPREYMFDADIVEIAKQGNGRYVPVEVNVVTRTDYVDGRYVACRTVHKRMDIDLAPDFNAIGAFVMDVPDGTPVYFLDSRQMQGVSYIWSRGKVVPNLDEIHEKMLDEETKRILADVNRTKSIKTLGESLIHQDPRKGGTQVVAPNHTSNDVHREGTNRARQLKWIVLVGGFGIALVLLLCRYSVLYRQNRKHHAE